VTDFAVATAGESHGRGLVALVTGLPFGLPLDVAAIDALLARRQAGFGRSSRMTLEHDRVEVLAGLHRGVTAGAPLALFVANVDDSLDRQPAVTRPRPGHADLAGALRFGITDARPVLERASARETAARVAGGAVAMQLLAAVGIAISSRVVAIGGVVAPATSGEDGSASGAARAAETGCDDPAASEAMRAAIREAGAAGDTLGGVVAVRATGVPPGLGSLETWTSRLDGRIAQAMLAIPSAKGVEIGDGFAAAAVRGSAAHDPIARDAHGFQREGNRAGGIEGGMSNGEPIAVRVAFKPLASLRQALPTAELAPGGASGVPAERPRSDVCAVPAAAVVAEAMLAIALATALRERFGGPSLADVVAAVAAERRRRATVFGFEPPAA
jgi:chorismate synthase